MKLRYENKADIPEAMTNSYVEFKEGELTVYVHVDYAEQLKAHYRLQGDHTETKRKMSEQSDRLTALVTAEDTRKREEEKRLLDHRSANGQSDEIIADLRIKLEANEKDWAGKFSTLQKDTRLKEKRAIVAELSALATDATKRELSRLISLDLDIAENGDILILDDDGKATSTTFDDYKKALPENYPSLIAEFQPSGGMGKGSTGGVGGDKKPEDYTEADRVALHKSNPDLFNKLFKPK
jgi:hypothetical protein